VPLGGLHVRPRDLSRRYPPAGRLFLPAPVFVSPTFIDLIDRRRKVENNNFERITTIVVKLSLFIRYPGSSDLSSVADGLISRGSRVGTTAFATRERVPPPYVSALTDSNTDSGRNRNNRRRNGEVLDIPSKTVTSDHIRCSRRRGRRTKDLFILV